jgi:hypothetical protein
MPPRKNKSVEAVAASTRPRFGRIQTAINYSGIGRSMLYIAAASHPGLFRKNGAAVIVDFDILDQRSREPRSRDHQPISEQKNAPDEAGQFEGTKQCKTYRILLPRATIKAHL